MLGRLMSQPPSLAIVSKASPILAILACQSASFPPLVLTSGDDPGTQPHHCGVLAGLDRRAGPVWPQWTLERSVELAALQVWQSALELIESCRRASRASG